MSPLTGYLNGAGKEPRYARCLLTGSLRDNEFGRYRLWINELLPFIRNLSNDTHSSALETVKINTVNFNGYSLSIISMMIYGFMPILTWVFIF